MQDIDDYFMMEMQNLEDEEDDEWERNLAWRRKNERTKF